MTQRPPLIHEPKVLEFCMVVGPNFDRNFYMIGRRSDVILSASSAEGQLLIWCGHGTFGRITHWMCHFLCQWDV
ncbi:hypothetical protein WN944_022049 [Citrus x changshan-huyou]|uniref:Uncharacterized protein n=1 Tax=Citrus x changshan-huyou TaxID=2935761 RepID=A0AAP0QVU4_9ROSI